MISRKILRESKNMAEKCKHQNIIITYKARHFIPEGWTKLMEKDDIDLAESFIEEKQVSVFCEDCGKEIEEGDNF